MKDTKCSGSCSGCCDRAKPYSEEEIEDFIGKFSEATEEEREDILGRLETLNSLPAGRQVNPKF